MSAAELMRQYITVVNPPNDDFLGYLVIISNQQVLREGRLTEAGFVDRIKAVTKQINDKYDDVKYGMLAKATTKAMTMFDGNPKVQGTLGRIAKIGKFAVKNRALLAILIGMTGTLIGYAHNSAAVAATAAKLDAALKGTSIDQIIHNLDISGIHIDAHGGAGTQAGGHLADIVSALPPSIGHKVETIAKALRAIEHYKFQTGETISADSELNMVGTVDKTQQTLHQIFTSSTSDGLTLAKLENTFTFDNNGATHMQEKLTGVEPDLEAIIGKLPEDQQEQLGNFITQGNPDSVVNSDSLIDQIKGIFDYKAPAIAGLVAAALMKKPDGKYRVQITRAGIKISGGQAGQTPAKANPPQTGGGAQPQPTDSGHGAPPVASSGQAQPAASGQPSDATPATAAQSAATAPRQPSDMKMWRQAQSEVMQSPDIAKQVATRYKALGGTWGSPPTAPAAQPQAAAQQQPVAQQQAAAPAAQPQAAAQPRAVYPPRTAQQRAQTTATPSRNPPVGTNSTVRQPLKRRSA